MMDDAVALFKPSTALHHEVGLYPRESGGVPFLVEALSLLAVRECGKQRAAPEQINLKHLVASWQEVLSQPALDLLGAASIATRPTELHLLARVVQQETRRLSACSELQAQRLIRTTGQAHDPKVECYHDRIRELVYGELPPTTRMKGHLALARLLEAQSAANPEVLFDHFHAGGETAMAALHANAAGTGALEGLAFEQAARFFAYALAHGEWGMDEERSLRTGQARALAEAGRSRQAAEAYRELAQTVPEDEQWRWQAKAAEQLLWGGYVDEGRTLMAEVLSVIGVRLPRSGAAAVAALLGVRAQLKLRGLKWQHRDPATIPEKALREADVLWAVGTGFAFVEPVIGSAFQARALLAALRTGEDTRIVRGLAGEAAYTAVFGGSGYERAERILEETWKQVQQLEAPWVRALYYLSSAIARFQQGRWLESHRDAAEARRLVVDSGISLVWEFNTAGFYWALTLGWLGRYQECREVCQALEADARTRGDLHSINHLVAGAVVPLKLLDDDPEGARTRLLGIMDSIPSRTGLLHSYVYRALAITEFYEHNEKEANRWVEKLTSVIRNPEVGNVIVIRIYAAYLQGALLLLEGALHPHRGLRVAKLNKLVKRLRRFGNPWAAAEAALLEGQMALLDNNRFAAELHLQRAETQFEQLHMAFHAILCRLGRHLGEGSDSEAAAYDELRAFARQECVSRPLSLAKLFAPVVGVMAAAGAPETS